MIPSAVQSATLIQMGKNFVGEGGGYQNAWQRSYYELPERKLEILLFF